MHLLLNSVMAQDTKLLNEISCTKLEYILRQKQTIYLTPCKRKLASLRVALAAEAFQLTHNIRYICTDARMLTY
jgi:hypothetical protein